MSPLSPVTSEKWTHFDTYSLVQENNHSLTRMQRRLWELFLIFACVCRRETTEKGLPLEQRIWLGGKKLKGNSNENEIQLESGAGGRGGATHGGDRGKYVM